MPTTGRSLSQAGGSGSRMVVRSRISPATPRTPSASESTSSEIGTTRIEQQRRATRAPRPGCAGRPDSSDEPAIGVPGRDRDDDAPQHRPDERADDLDAERTTRKASSASRITRSMKRSLKKSLPWSIGSRGPSCRTEASTPGNGGARLRSPAGRWSGRRPACARPGPRPAGPRRRCSWTGSSGWLSVTFQGASGSNRTRSAGAPLASRPASSPRMRAGASVMVRSRSSRPELALVHQPQAHRQHGLDADHAAGGLGEGQPLAVLVLRAVVAGDRRRSCRRAAPRPRRAGRPRRAAAARPWRRSGSPRPRAR